MREKRIKIRIQKGNFKRKIDYDFISMLTHQPKLARILRDWEDRNWIPFIQRILEGMIIEKE